MDILIILAAVSFTILIFLLVNSLVGKFFSWDIHNEAQAKWKRRASLWGGSVLHAVDEASG